MTIITITLATLVVLEQFYILYLETLATQSKATGRVFNMSQEELARPSVDKLFKNQGIYNGLIAYFSYTAFLFLKMLKWLWYS